MSATQKSKDLVLRYFNSWQEPADYADFRSCITDNLIFDSNIAKIEGGDALTNLYAVMNRPGKMLICLALYFWILKLRYFMKEQQKREV